MRQKYDATWRKEDKDTRGEKRFSIIKEQNAQCEDYSVKIHQKVFDLSEGGLFIKSVNPFPEGYCFQLTLTLFTSPEPIRALGRVMYSKKDYGMGIQLSGVSSHDAEKIKALVGETEASVTCSDRFWKKKLFAYEFRDFFGNVIGMGDSDQWFFQPDRKGEANEP